MAVVQDIGHVTLQVGDMEQALRFYREALGFQVPGKVDPAWTVITTKGGIITLYRRDAPTPCALAGGGTPFNLHVANFQAAADALERAGYVVHRLGESAGSVEDPWGNVLALHDHRQND